MRALELVLEARAITAAGAEAAGLVNHVLHGDVLARAQDLAVRYAQRPRAVVAAQKAVFNDTVSLSESLTREAILEIVGSCAARAGASSTR
jgi:enoyl-CoA hydratase/carnithine racemase